MKKISYWASTNRLKAISIIVLIQIVLSAIYFYGGIYFFAAGIQFSEWVGIIAGSLFVIAWFFHPMKGSTWEFLAYSFERAKSWQAVILLSTCMMMMNAGNQLARSSMITSTDINFEARNIVLDLRPNTSVKKKKSKKRRRLSRKNMKRKFRSMVKGIRDRGNVRLGDVLGFILVAAAFTFLLGYVVLALYCNLYCSGAAGAAALVLVAGALLWGFGIVKIFRWIVQDNPKNRAKKKLQQSG